VAKPIQRQYPEIDLERPNDNISVDDEKGPQIVTAQGAKAIDVLETARAQSRWNSYAAAAASLSAILQASALLLTKLK